jgi:hypothetical protein
VAGVMGAIMRILRAVLAAAVCCAPAPSFALEGSAALKSVSSVNAVNAWGVVVGWIKKFR